MYKILETTKDEEGRVVNEVVLTDECQHCGKNKVDPPQEIDFRHWHGCICPDCVKLLID